MKSSFGTNDRNMLHPPASLGLSLMKSEPQVRSAFSIHINKNVICIFLFLLCLLHHFRLEHAKKSKLWNFTFVILFQDQIYSSAPCSLTLLSKHVSVSVTRVWIAQFSIAKAISCSTKVRFPIRARLSSVASIPALNLTQASIQCVTKTVYPGMKRLESKAVHTPSLNSDVNNVGSIPPLPHASPWRRA